MRTKWLVFLVATLAVSTLWGCGSNGGSGGSDVGGDDPATVDSVGIQNCSVCHEAFKIAWDGETNRHNNNVTDRDPRPSSVAGREECEVCHDPTGDSANVFPSRPVVGCEGCHGGGSAHRGVGPIPYSYPDPEQCAACHDSHFSAQSNIGTAVLASTHNNSDDLHASRAKCQRCHTKEGSLAFSGYTGDKDVMDQMDSDNDNVTPFNEEDLNPVTCTACHDAHNGALRADSFIVRNDMSNWDPNGNMTADQFDFCTSCHTVINQDGVLIGSGNELSGSSPVFPGTSDAPAPWTVQTAPFYHNTAWYRTATTTHFDNPATGPQELDRNGDLNQNTAIEGYVVRLTVEGENNQNPCFDCHGHELRTNTRHSMDEPEADDNPADFGSTIHTQWASSGHAAGLLKEKYAADSGDRSEENVDNVMLAFASDDSSNGGFTHYNWDRTGRASCQMCHTATGFMNYAMDNYDDDGPVSPPGYNAANNNFSHLAGWTASPGAGSPQNELLYCWGCHDNAGAGTLRVTGAVTAVYTYNDEPVVFPDAGSSNTCNVCHSGRGNNEDASTSSRFAGHHAPAAADLYSEDSHVAYEYPGLDYTNASYFAHDIIGINADTPETGSGPCVSCHMGADTSHTFFEVAEKDDNGFIINIPNQALCDTCHTPDGQFEMTPAILEEESEGYQQAGELLNDYLNQENGLTNYTGAVIDNDNALENDRGAFQNAKFPTDEPGGFTHNRFYVKRALFDGIDWVDNGVLDGTISDNSAGYPEAMNWLGTTRPTP
ncbi:cytochrome c3 family protein [Deltaproteobacteria bacterium IMCC39524]|nr:cytochrome c3 family protein [Deltaproteobacteria bacterium IMCC39524]